MTPDDGPSAWSRWRLGLREREPARPLCLTLANTRHWRHAAAPHERLHTFADVIELAVLERIVDGAHAQGLADVADADRAAARDELAATLALREAVYRLFAARARGTQAPQDDVAALMTSFHAALHALLFELRDGALVPTPRTSDVALDVVRLQCAVSAVALLSDGHTRGVKECADERGCGRLFLDVTRNRSRRYCEADECGNRARQAAYRHRHRLLASR